MEEQQVEHKDERDCIHCGWAMDEREGEPQCTRCGPKRNEDEKE